MIRDGERAHADAAIHRSGRLAGVVVVGLRIDPESDLDRAREAGKSVTVQEIPADVGIRGLVDGYLILISNDFLVGKDGVVRVLDVRQSRTEPPGIAVPHPGL